MDLYKATAAIFPIFASLTWIILHKIHIANEVPYIDEEFHVPQVQRYCGGNYEWDPKITTPPGLYFASIAALKTLDTLGFLKDTFLCDIYLLRLTNFIFICLIFISLALIIKRICKKTSLWINIIDLLSLSTFPILYFFSFLYYTDVISTFSVLIMFCAYHHDKIMLSAIFGFISLWMRQTNVIWVAFLAAIYGYNLLNDLLKEEKIKLNQNDIIGRLAAGLKRPKIILSIVLKETPFIAVALSFIAFVLWNGSIVLGDKSAHQATIHIPQLFYFSLICAVFSPGNFLYNIPQFLHFVRKNLFFSITSLLAIALILQFNSMAHPYLLADNRHYAFYLWKRLLQPWPLKFLLVPVYFFCMHTIMHQLSHQGLFFQIIYVVCVVSSLVPQMLLEPRYFTIPFLIFKLHATQQKISSSLVNLSVSLFVNIFTIYVYIYCPFTPESKVRFIW